MDVAAILNDLNAAERAYERVQPEMKAIQPADYTALNVDVVSATSVVLGVADRVIEHRDRLATLPEFDINHVDKLVDYAAAAWYVFITTLHTTTPENFEALKQECSALRDKLLTWAAPLVADGAFDEAVIAKIKEGSGNKDTPSDVVALVGLYRSKWDEVENKCAVTEADLDRGAQIGPYVFAMVSQREQSPTLGTTDEAHRIRRAWTLVDRAYDQCRRGLTYLLWSEGTVDRVAPSLRRNSGPRQSTATPPAIVTPPQAPPPPAPGNGSAPVGGGDGPFAGAGE